MSPTRRSIIRRRAAIRAAVVLTRRYLRQAIETRPASNAIASRLASPPEGAAQPPYRRVAAAFVAVAAGAKLPSICRASASSSFDRGESGFEKVNGWPVFWARMATA
jgi:hypothetical protein